MINNAILQNCKTKKKNVSTARIDYKKAFDSVPHSWILRCLQMYKIHPELIAFMEQSMSQLEDQHDSSTQGGGLRDRTN